MIDPNSFVVMASVAVAGLSLASLAALRGWQGWLDLKRLELGSAREQPPSPPSMARIEVADLKERIRKLEAIASGIDL